MNFAKKHMLSQKIPAISHTFKYAEAPFPRHSVTFLTSRSLIWIRKHISATPLNFYTIHQRFHFLHVIFKQSFPTTYAQSQHSIDEFRGHFDTQGQERRIAFPRRKPRKIPHPQTLSSRHPSPRKIFNNKKSSIQPRNSGRITIPSKKRSISRTPGAVSQILLYYIFDLNIFIY